MDWREGGAEVVKREERGEEEPRNYKESIWERQDCRSEQAIPGCETRRRRVSCGRGVGRHRQHYLCTRKKKIFCQVRKGEREVEGDEKMLSGYWRGRGTGEGWREGKLPGTGKQNVSQGEEDEQVEKNKYGHIC